ncbi:long-chain fatty acid--CoA ligase [Natronosporangium hydrolyticum]|uniref:Long-chain fatty acid--CoA ligase n=1 Tax=Natronosporangium hydrolyticum TaxID=2811111 RepID=A0A895YEZ6_9ACTN|nr:long-chain fatty acid--CoA ligase [Natronosporangium hydrolyticum]QSB13983.1 long-chain fatty acid--CoA ligase [Natronosporangium hydrolyticum]
MRLQDRLARLLREAPARAQAIEHNGRWWRWGAIRSCAGAVDTLLTTAGVGPGGRVGIVLQNRPEQVAALLATLATGRRVVPLRPWPSPDQLAQEVAAAELPVLLGAPETLPAGELPPDTVTAAVAADGRVRLLGGGGAAGRRAANQAATRPPAPDHRLGAGPAIEMLTSGTTGPPKRIHLTERQLAASLLASGQLPAPGQLLTDSTSLVAAPLGHIGGLWATLGALTGGRRLVLMSRFGAVPWSELVARHQIRATFLAPAAIWNVLDEAVPPERLRSLKLVTSGAAACPPELADQFFRRYGARVLMTYGATEFVGAVAGWSYPLHEQWWERKAGSAGRAYPGVTLRVTDPAGQPLPTGEVGRLEVRTEQSAHGPHEWVRTSDLAELDDDGFLWLRGRADDVIVRGGFKVQPATVQRALERHPAVREAAVTGLPDPRLGQVPVAVVEVRPGHRPPTEAELDGLCRERLAPYERPRHLVVVASLPRTPATKVDRGEVLALVRTSINGDPAA